MSSTRPTLREAFEAGFMASGEGFNGEMREMGDEDMYAEVIERKFREWMPVDWTQVPFDTPVTIWPREDRASGMVRDTEPGLQPWGARFLGTTFEGKLVIKPDPEHGSHIREVEPDIVRLCNT